MLRRSLQRSGHGTPRGRAGRSKPPPCHCYLDRWLRHYSACNASGYYSHKLINLVSDELTWLALGNLAPSDMQQRQACNYMVIFRGPDRPIKIAS